MSKASKILNEFRPGGKTSSTTVSHIVDQVSQKLVKGKIYKVSVIEDMIGSEIDDPDYCDPVIDQLERAGYKIVE